MGGSALCLLGSARETLVVDYSIESELADTKSILQKLAFELKLDLESVLLSDYIPLPPHAEQRHLFVGQFGRATVYIFDLYSIALCKIARGFESDLDDVIFLLVQSLIEWNDLEEYLQAMLPLAKSADFEPNEFCEYFETLKLLMNRA